jgi:hypothetical protein
MGWKIPTDLWNKTSTTVKWCQDKSNQKQPMGSLLNMKRATQTVDDGKLLEAVTGTDVMGRTMADSATALKRTGDKGTTMEIDRGTIIITILILPDATLTIPTTKPCKAGPMVVDRWITTTTINQHRKVADGAKTIKI